MRPLPPERSLWGQFTVYLQGAEREHMRVCRKDPEKPKRRAPSLPPGTPLAGPPESPNQGALQAQADGRFTHGPPPGLSNWEEGDSIFTTYHSEPFAVNLVNKIRNQPRGNGSMIECQFV